jgi:hypothetical protein
VAKVKGPLFSEEAQGAVGGLLSFRGGPAGVHVSRPGIAPSAQRRIPSEAQAAQRELYRLAVARWKALTDGERAGWAAAAAASGRPVTGFNLFLVSNLRATPEPEPEPLTFASAIGPAGWVWTLDSAADWELLTDAGPDGGPAVRSAAPLDWYGFSARTIVTGPAVLRWSWRVTGEAFEVICFVALEGIEDYRWLFERAPWSAGVMHVPSGEETLLIGVFSEAPAPFTEEHAYFAGFTLGA